MDIYEYAMQMEKDGENYYRELAQKTPNTGLRNILTMLADAEVVHYNTFKKMNENLKVELPETTILRDVKNVFVMMKGSGELLNINLSQTELYKKAQDIEKKSEDFYLNKAKEVEDLSQKRILVKIAGEENNHYLILENIINFISRPEEWLENAEWYGLGE